MGYSIYWCILYMHIYIYIYTCTFQRLWHMCLCGYVCVPWKEEGYGELGLGFTMKIRFGPVSQVAKSWVRQGSISTGSLLSSSLAPKVSEISNCLSARCWRYSAWFYLGKHGSFGTISYFYDFGPLKTPMFAKRKKDGSMFGTWRCSEAKNPPGISRLQILQVIWVREEGLATIQQAGRPWSTGDSATSTVCYHPWWLSGISEYVMIQQFIVFIRLALFIIHIFRNSTHSWHVLFNHKLLYMLLLAESPTR